MAPPLVSNWDQATLSSCSDSAPMIHSGCAIFSPTRRCMGVQPVPAGLEAYGGDRCDRRTASWMLTIVGTRGVALRVTCVPVRGDSGSHTNCP